MDIRQTTSGVETVEYLSQTLRTHLEAGEKVLWLLSGGSVIKLAVQTAQQLAKLSPDQLANLTVSLVDERYGPVGHADSNWEQLLKAGFTLPGARLAPVLTGKDRATTTTDFAAFLEQQFANSTYRLGVFGIGPDGHTSGILPNSSAVTATGLAFTYDGGGYQRITTTIDAIKQLDEALVYVVGKEKWPTVAQLTDTIDVARQPAQLLKQVPKLTIFTDYTEGQA